MITHVLLTSDLPVVDVDHTMYFFEHLMMFSRCIVTCGSDGDVRIWESLDDDDPKSINVGEKVYSVALKVS